MKILITGGNGFIARALTQGLSSEHQVTSTNRQNLDLTALQALNKFFQDKYFDVVLHCAVQGGSRLKQDSFQDMDINLAMYYNLLQHKPHYGKLLHFGSGAEFADPESPYGLSKRVIAKSISDTANFYNLRIYNVFGPTELPTRFIRGSIQRYLNREPMIIHQDKFMDFFYMQDLISLVDHYIKNDDLSKEVNCSYNRVWMLSKIASFINTLDSYQVDIEFKQPGQGKGYFYNGINHMPNLNFVGLEQGIRETYNLLKK